jgi:hypothetical protein
MKPDVLTALQTASKGLLYPSETDEPFEPFSWGKADGDLTPQKVVQLAKAAAGAAVEEQPLADFFKYLTAEGAEHGAEFRILQQVIGQQLSGVRVFRIGAVGGGGYIVGRTAEGEWAGLKTHSVET